MSKQKSIIHFFKSTGTATKRASEQDNNSMKRIKSDENGSNEIMDLNCSKAKEKLTKLNQELNLMDVNMGSSWFFALENEFSQPYFTELDKFLTAERKQYNVYPEHCNVWAWTKMCSLKDVKVVIIGQDPYHNPGQAHGLCFSVPRGVRPPPSLLNIYKEIATDIPGFKAPSHGDLTPWAKQGVLLLNASLTVRQNAPNSHADKGWAKLTDSVIKNVSNKNSGVVFLLWGAFAQKKAACVDKNRHHLLSSVHPSPLAASRGFFGCKHFSECNRLLEAAGKSPIDWTL